MSLGRNPFLPAASASTASSTAPGASPLIKSFGLNTQGRDWIATDLHGAYDLMKRAMREANFDLDRDRLFINGDLVDRGLDSLRARRFLQLPCVHATRGNHEAFWLEMYEDGPPDEKLVEVYGRIQRMGVQWWLDAPKDERDALVAMFKDLPLVIEVETHRGLVGMVHADVPKGMDWATFKSAILRGDDKVIQTALQGRTRISYGDDSGVVGIDRLFVGHTIQWGGLKRLGNVYALDTGAVFLGTPTHEGAGKLTMVEMVAKTCSLADLQGAGPNPAIDLRWAEVGAVDTPFGNYARPATRA